MSWDEFFPLSLGLILLGRLGLGLAWVTWHWLLASAGWHWLALAGIGWHWLAGWPVACLVG